MIQIRDTIGSLEDKYNVNNVKNINNLNNVNNVIDKYSLKSSGFVPMTEETQLADEISKSMGDEKSYAGYLRVVRSVGIGSAKRLLVTVLDEIRNKDRTKSPVRNKGAYFMFIYKKKLY